MKIRIPIIQRPLLKVVILGDFWWLLMSDWKTPWDVDFFSIKAVTFVGLLSPRYPSSKFVIPVQRCSSTLAFSGWCGWETQTRHVFPRVWPSRLFLPTLPETNSKRPCRKWMLGRRSLSFWGFGLFLGVSWARTLIGACDWAPHFSPLDSTWVWGLVGVDYF